MSRSPLLGSQDLKQNRMKNRAKFVGKDELNNDFFSYTNLSPDITESSCLNAFVAVKKNIK